MRFALVKSEEQSDIRALRRARSRPVAERTAPITHLRALLPERGIAAPKGRGKLEDRLEAFADEEGGGLSPRARLPVEDLRAAWREPDERIAAFDRAFARMAKENAASRRLATIPGIGAIDATAPAAAVGDARSFGRGRDLAARPGRAPRQASTGGKPGLLGISKRGDRYLRANLIHGARAALPAVLAQASPLGRRARALPGRAHKNVVVVALAAKPARIVRAALRRERPCDPAAAAAWERAGCRNTGLRPPALSAGGERKTARRSNGGGET